MAPLELQSIECEAYRDVLNEIAFIVRRDIKENDLSYGYQDNGLDPTENILKYKAPLESLNWSGYRRQRLLQRAVRQTKKDKSLEVIMRTSALPGLNQNRTLTGRSKDAPKTAWLEDVQSNISLRMDTITRLCELQAYLNERSKQRAIARQAKATVKSQLKDPDLRNTNIAASKPQETSTQSFVPSTEPQAGSKRRRALSASSNSSSSSECGSIEEIPHSQPMPKKLVSRSTSEMTPRSVRPSSGPVTKKPRLESSPTTNSLDNEKFDVFDVSDSPEPGHIPTSVRKAVVKPLRLSLASDIHTGNVTSFLPRKSPILNPVSSSKTPTQAFASTPKATSPSFRVTSPKASEVAKSPLVGQGSFPQDTSGSSEPQNSMADDERIEQKLKEHPWITEKLTGISRDYPGSNVYLVWEDDTLQIGCRDCPGRYYRVNFYAGSLNGLYKHLPGQKHIDNAERNRDGGAISKPVPSKRVQKMVGIAHEQSPKSSQAATIPSIQPGKQFEVVENPSTSVSSPLFTTSPLINQHKTVSATVYSGFNPINIPRFDSQTVPVVSASLAQPGNQHGLLDKPLMSVPSFESTANPVASQVKTVPVANPSENNLLGLYEQSATLVANLCGTHTGFSRLSGQAASPIQPAQLNNPTINLSSQHPVPKQNEPTSTLKISDIINDPEAPKDVAERVAGIQQRIQNKLDVIMDYSNREKVIENRLQLLEKGSVEHSKDAQNKLDSMNGRIEDRERHMRVYVGEVNRVLSSHDTRLKAGVGGEVQLRNEFTSLETKVSNFQLQVQNMHQRTLCLPGQIRELGEQMETLKTETWDFIKSTRGESEAKCSTIMELEENLKTVQQRMGAVERLAPVQNVCHDSDIRRIWEEFNTRKEAAASQQLAQEKEIERLQQQVETQQATHDKEMNDINSKLKEMNDTNGKLKCASDQQLAQNEDMLRVRKEHLKEMSELQKNHNEDKKAAQARHGREIIAITQNSNTAIGAHGARITQLEDQVKQLLALLQPQAAFTPVVQGSPQAGIPHVSQGGFTPVRRESSQKVIPQANEGFRANTGGVKSRGGMKNGGAGRGRRGSGS